MKKKNKAKQQNADSANVTQEVPVQGAGTPNDPLLEEHQQEEHQQEEEAQEANDQKETPKATKTTEAPREKDLKDTSEASQEVNMPLNQTDFEKSPMGAVFHIKAQLTHSFAITRKGETTYRRGGQIFSASSQTYRVDRWQAKAILEDGRIEVLSSDFKTKEATKA